MVVFCYKDIHVGRNEYEDNRKVSSTPQSTTSESLAVNAAEARAWPTSRYLDVSHDESCKKGHRNGKTKLMKAYLYTNQLK